MFNLWICTLKYNTIYVVMTEECQCSNFISFCIWSSLITTVFNFFFVSQTLSFVIMQCIFIFKCQRNLKFKISSLFNFDLSLSLVTVEVCSCYLFEVTNTPFNCSHLLRYKDNLFIPNPIFWYHAVLYL